MIFDRSEHVSSLDAIQESIDSISPGSANRTGHTCINVIHNEFIFIEGSMEIPHIPVKELDMASSASIVEALASFIPEYLSGHKIPEKRIPSADQHMLHFTRRFPGKIMDFNHIFKADLKFAGDPSGIIEKGNPDFYPSFLTDRIYYKSRLIPESSLHRGDDSGPVDPVRIHDTRVVESDQFFHTFAMFEDLNERELTGKFYEHLDRELFGISPELYPFVVYDYFTACFNVLNPVQKEIEAAVSVFEPLFLYLYSRFHNIKKITTAEAVESAFGDLLSFEGPQLEMTDHFRERLKEYFSRWKLVHDDEMMLRGWWRFETE